MASWYCPLACETLIYDCFGEELLLNVEVCVHIDHNQWYSCSQSCFPFIISHWHTSWRFVPEYTHVEKLTFIGSHWNSICRTALRWWYVARGTVTGQCRGEGETREYAHYAALTSEVRDRKDAGGHSAKLEQRYFLFSKQPPIIWFNAFYWNVKDRTISEHLLILYYHNSVFILRLFVCFENPCKRILQNV